MGRLPLEGIRILEPGWIWAVPYAGRLLGDMGAQVIKVESCVRLDTSRTGGLRGIGPEEEHWNQGYGYNERARNKLGVTLDLTKPEGANLFKELVKVSDVVLENYAPRVMRNFGLDYPVLKEVNPGIIMVSASGYGQDGPWEHYGAWGMSLEPMSGFSHMTGYKDGPPLRGGIAYTDPLSSHAVAFAVMLALEYRRRTGVGQYIDLAQYEVGVTLMAESILDYLMNGRIHTPAANEHPSMAPHNVYPCKGDDMWIAIAVSSDEEWEALRRAMGDPEWAMDKRFGDVVSRWRHREELDEKIGEWTFTWNHYELMLTLQRAGVPAGAAFNSKEICLDPHLKARSFFTKITHPPRAGSLGTRLYPDVPWKMSRVPDRAHDPSPTLGQHNREILGDLLGLPEGELAELEDQDIVGTRPLGYAMRPPRQVPLEELKKRGTIRDYDTDFMEILGREYGF